MKFISLTLLILTMAACAGLPEKKTKLMKTSKADGIKLSVTRENESIIATVTNVSNPRVYMHGRVSIFRLKVVDSRGHKVKFSELGKQKFPKAPEEEEIDEEHPGKKVYHRGWALTKPGVTAEKKFDLKELFVLKPGVYKVSVYIVYSEDKKSQSILVVDNIPLTVK